MRGFIKKQGVLGFSITILCLAIIGTGHGVETENIEVLLLFDEGQGDTAMDLSGKGRHAAITGAQWVDGVFGTGLDYDGVDDEVIVTDYFGVLGTDPRTTVLWFKSKDAREHSWVKWGPDATGEKYYIRSHLDGENCYLRVEVAGGQNYGDTNVCDGQWHHLAVVFPQGSDSVQDHDLYVDGQLEPDIGNDQDMNTTADPHVNMGNFLAHHDFVFGTLDEVAIFNVGLTEAEINTIMGQGLAAVTTDVEPLGKLTTTWGNVKAAR